MTISDWLLLQLQAEIGAKDPSLVRVEQLSAAFRDLELAATLCEVRGAIHSAKEIYTQASSLRDLLVNGPSAPSPVIFPCVVCGMPSVLERICDGVSTRVCAEHVED